MPGTVYSSGCARAGESCLVDSLTTLLLFRVFFLVVQATSLGTFGDSFWFPFFGRHRHRQNQLSQFVCGIRYISSLIAKPLTRHNDLAGVGDAASVFGQKSFLDGGRQAFGAGNIPAQLDASINFVNVLPTGSAGAAEREFEFAERDGDF